MIFFALCENSSYFSRESFENWIFWRFSLAQAILFEQMLEKILFITSFSREIWWYFHKSWRTSTPRRTCSPDYVDFWKLMHKVFLSEHCLEPYFCCLNNICLSCSHLVQNNLVIWWFFLLEKQRSNFISDKPIF